MPKEGTPNQVMVRAVFGFFYLIMAFALASQTQRPVLVASAAILSMLHEPSWTIAKRMHALWLPAAIASAFQANLAFLVRVFLWNGPGGSRLFALLLVLSGVFALVAIEEGIRELRWRAAQARAPS
jgi:hypothetical protein